ncbi:MAG: hypothetical protein OQL16_09620 [Gammaproteobacteria bacterium]|nr:hypothetical protein [Gammaproteobacteria bacterium]
MEIDLNTADTDEYKSWLALLSEISRIQDALKNNPNKEGLRLARSHAYNLLADIQAMLDLEHLQSQPVEIEEESSL